MKRKYDSEDFWNALFLYGIGAIPGYVVLWALTSFAEFLLTGNASWMMALRDWVGTFEPGPVVRLHCLMAVIVGLLSMHFNAEKIKVKKTEGSGHPWWCSCGLNTSESSPKKNEFKTADELIRGE